MSATRLAKSAIKIPNYIERKPTDILKALASSSKYSPLTPEPSLQDDPFLLPPKAHFRRIFLLSKLSGIKTARFILNKYPDLLYRDYSEPKIKLFRAPEEFTADMDLNEDDINWCIDNLDVGNAIIAFKALESKGIELQQETLLKFFEMVCFANEDPLPTFHDHESAKLTYKPQVSPDKQFSKNSGLVWRIFDRLKDTAESPRVYSAMIAGLCSHNEFAKADQTFKQFVTNHPDQGLFIQAYEGLMEGVIKLNSSAETAREASMKITDHMRDNLVKPSLLVYNFMLANIFRLYCDDKSTKEAFEILNDMKVLNIEPSLNTFCHIISIISKARTYDQSRIIISILDYIKNSDSILTIRDPNDAYFLKQTMHIFATRLHDANFASKLHKIYLKKPIFANFTLHQAYLDTYFKLIITTGNLQQILKFYEDYTRFHFEPSTETYDALADALDLYQASDEVVKMITADIIKFNLAGKLKNDKLFRDDPDYINALNYIKTARQFN